jgi:hypothetical protein
VTLALAVLAVGGLLILLWLAVRSVWPDDWSDP